MKNILLVIGVMLSIMSCGSPPEQPTQSFWKCWNTDTVLYREYGPQPHIVPNPAAEHICLDSELIQAGYIKDANAKNTGGWRYK
jgi:hypothetical protein